MPKILIKAPQSSFLLYSGHLLWQGWWISSCARRYCVVSTCGSGAANVSLTCHRAKVMKQTLPSYRWRLVAPRPDLGGSSDCRSEALQAHWFANLTQCVVNLRWTEYRIFDKYFCPVILLIIKHSTMIVCIDTS